MSPPARLLHSPTPTLHPPSPQIITSWKRPSFDVLHLFAVRFNKKLQTECADKQKKEKRLLFDSWECFELCVSRPKFRFQPDIILSNSACSELFSRCACETRFCFFPFSFDVNPFFPPHVASRVAWSSQTLNFLF